MLQKSNPQDSSARLPQQTSNLHSTPEAAWTIPAKSTCLACSSAQLTDELPRLNANSPAHLYSVARLVQGQHLQRKKVRKHAEILGNSNLPNTPEVGHNYTLSWDPPGLWHPGLGNLSSGLPKIKKNKSGCLELHQKLRPEQEQLLLYTEITAHLVHFNLTANIQLHFLKKNTKKSAVTQSPFRLLLQRQTVTDPLRGPP